MYPTGLLLTTLMYVSSALFSQRLKCYQLRLSSCLLQCSCLLPLFLRSLRALLLQLLDASLIHLQFTTVCLSLCPVVSTRPLVMCLYRLTMLSDSEAIASFHSFLPSFCSFSCAFLWCSISALRASGSSLPISSIYQHCPMLASFLPESHKVSPTNGCLLPSEHNSSSLEPSPRD